MLKRGSNIYHVTEVILYDERSGRIFQSKEPLSTKFKHVFVAFHGNLLLVKARNLILRALTIDKFPWKATQKKHA